MIVGERFDTQPALHKLSTTIKQTPDADVSKLLRSEA